MAYLDFDTPTETPEMEEERKRKLVGALLGQPTSGVLGAPRATAPPNLASYQPDSRSYDLAVGATSQPRVPQPNIQPAEAPSIGGSPSPSAGGVLGRPAVPARPDVMPQRGDFQAKPELGGWKKYLGLGAGVALGSAPLVQDVLHGQRNAAERQYQGANQEWERNEADKTRQAQIRNIDSEIQARKNPKPEKPDTLNAQEAQAVEELVAKGVPRVDAIGQVKGAGQKPPNPTFQEQNYSEWAQARKAAGKPSDRMTFEKELKGAERAPEREPRQLMEVPQEDGSVKIVEARPGTVLPKGAKKVGAQDKGPSADEQRRADLGKNLNENIAAYEDIVRRRPDLFGPLAGRKTAMLMMTGSSDPDIAALRSIKEFAGMAAVGTHAMRNAQHVKIASDAMMNLNDQPEAILAENGPLARARTSIQTFIGDVEGQRVQDTKGDTVNVISPDGTPGTIPRANLQKALKAGYKQAQ